MQQLIIEKLKKALPYAGVLLLGLALGAVSVKRNIEQKHKLELTERVLEARAKTAEEVSSAYEKLAEQQKESFRKSLEENSRTVERIVEKPGGERIVERVVERSSKATESKEAETVKVAEKSEESSKKTAETTTKVVEKIVIETTEKKVETSRYPSFSLGVLAGADGTPVKDSSPKLTYGLHAQKHFGPLGVGAFGLLRHEDKRLGVGASLSWSF